MADSAMVGELKEWLETPPGLYALSWERTQLDDIVTDLFGYHAIQLGLAQINTLESNRMPHQWLGMEELIPRAAFVTEFSALPFAKESLDLVTLPHTLELSRDPHSVLRDVARVLVPHGRVVICGLNPISLWGLRQYRVRLSKRLGWGGSYLPQDEGGFIGYRRIRDWLRLLNFEVESARFGCYKPAVRSEKWLNRFNWMDKLGSKWWPIFGATYVLVATKRVHGMRLISPAWKVSRPSVVTTAPIAGRAHFEQAAQQYNVDAPEL